MSFPIELNFKSAMPGAKTGPNRDGTYSLRTFNSYSFSRNILTPAAPFRFTAPGIDSVLRRSIRSGDTVFLWAVNDAGKRYQIATGFIDETDTHVIPTQVEYVLTGRDTIGQLVDNAVVDAQNKIINVEKQRIDQILGLLIQNTRIPPGFKPQDTPTAPLLFQTNAGETKINALQRYLDFTNCLVWSQPNGQLVIGKPNFHQRNSGVLSLNSSGKGINNLLEVRVRRSPNLSIRQIVVQLQTLAQVDAGAYTVKNFDSDMVRLAQSNVGRSVYEPFTYGNGGDTVNLITQVGNQKGDPNSIGASKARREIARESMKIIDIEAVVRGHINENGIPYNIDQMYEVQVNSDDVHEDMYVYSVDYDMTIEHGMLTHLHLCRKGTICADAAALGPAS